MSQIELTTHQRQELGTYLNQFRDDTHRDPLKLCLVIAGDRPAAFISPVPWISLRSPLTFHNGTVKLFELFNLSSCEMKKVPGWFVSRSAGRLDCLPTILNNCAAYHRRLGTVLGYPLSEIETFINNDENVVPEEFAKRDVFDLDKLAYSKFVCYVPEPTEDGYRRAIRRGKQFYARLCTLSEIWGLPEIRSLANNIRYEFVRNVESNEPVLGETT